MFDFFHSAIIFGILCALAALGAIIYVRRKAKFSALDYRVLKLQIPRAEAGPNPDFIQEINLSEQLINGLAAIGRPLVFEVAVRHDSEAIEFFLGVPASSLDLASRQIHGLFPTALVQEVSDYSIFYPSGSHAEAYLALDKSYLLPISTYREANVDTFAPILSTLSKIKQLDEGASLQFIIKPTGSILAKKIAQSLEALKQGKSLKEAANLGTFKAKDLETLFFLSQKPKDEPKEKNIDEEAIKAIQQKMAKPIYSANVRIVTASRENDRADDLLMSISNAFAGFSATHRNNFKVLKVNRPAQSKRLIFDYIFREFSEGEELILNAEELASLFHLPISSSNIPRVAFVKGKEAPAPANLTATDGVALGTNSFRQEERLVYLGDDDRRRHLYLIGQTGTGKSTLMLNLALQDIQAGRGLCLVDPHGDLVNKVLGLIPPERAGDVIVFDPGDLALPLGLNMLEYDLSKPEEKTFIVNEMQSIFNQLFSKETMGPMFEKYMRNALLLLMEDAKTEPATLMEMPRIFSDQAFRERKLARISNPTVIDFWTKEAPKTTGEQGLANMGPYITSKFDNFISNDYIRPIIGQTKSAFNFREVMDGSKILLVNLSKGKIGDLNSALLGMIITGRILLAALSRENVAEAERRDFYLYIDEFQNYTTDSIATILSEARKYRLSLTVAHQFIAQLKDNIREAIFGNVGNLISFRVGSTDTEVLTKYFAPTFSEKDLTGLENLTAAAKILVKGEPVTPFSLRFHWPTGGSEVRADKLKELSRLSYGQDLTDIEQAILKRLRD